MCVRYVQLQYRRLAEHQSVIALQLAELQRRQAIAHPVSNGKGAAAAAAAAAGDRPRQIWLGRRAAAGAAAAAALLSGGHPLVRLARLLPLLWLLQDAEDAR